MRYKPLVLFLLTCLFLFSYFSYAWQGKVVEVTDGDTLTVQRNDREVNVRLYGNGTERLGRVDEGSFLPPSPTEPLVRLSRKRLLVVVASLRDC